MKLRFASRLARDLANDIGKMVAVPLGNVAVKELGQVARPAVSKVQGKIQGTIDGEIKKIVNGIVANILSDVTFNLNKRSVLYSRLTFISVGACACSYASFLPFWIHYLCFVVTLSIPTLIMIQSVIQIRHLSDIIESIEETIQGKLSEVTESVETQGWKDQMIKLASAVSNRPIAEYTPWITGLVFFNLSRWYKENQVTINSQVLSFIIASSALIFTNKPFVGSLLGFVGSIVPFISNYITY